MVSGVVVTFSLLTFSRLSRMCRTSGPPRGIVRCTRASVNSTSSGTRRPPPNAREKA